MAGFFDSQNPGTAGFFSNLGMALLAAGQGGQPVGTSRFAQAAPFLGQAINSPMQGAQMAMQSQMMQAQLAAAKQKAARQELWTNMLNKGSPAADPMGIGEVGPVGGMGGMGGNPYVSLMDADKGIDFMATQQAKANEPPTGYMPTLQGLAPRPGGPADPATIARDAEARNPFIIQKIYDPETNTEQTVMVPRSAYTGGIQAPGATPGEAPPTTGLPSGSRVLSGKPVQMTDAQAMTANYATRMAEAESVLSQFDNEGASLFGRTAEGAPLGLGNYVQSNEYQKFAQARNNFINANLRRESGAVINKDEYANADEQYFPVPGDKPEVIEQKRQNRASAIKSFQNAAGPGYKPPKIEPAKKSVEAMSKEELRKMDPRTMAPDQLRKAAKRWNEFRE